MSLRARVHEAFDGPPSLWWHRVDDAIVLAAVFVSTTCLVLETMPSLAGWAAHFRSAQHAAGAVFLFEYALRIWSCVEDPEHAQPLVGRLRYALRPGTIVDAISVIPFVLSLIWPTFAFSTTLALLRVLRVFKVVRYVPAFRSFADVFRAKSAELFVALSGAVILLFLASSLVYTVEHEAQPERFDSIPSALWWGIVTMTTVGYGDLVPVTGVGRLVGAVVSLLGVGIVALPAGLLAAGFSDSIQREQRKHHLSERDLQDLIEAGFRYGARGDESFRDLGPRVLLNEERRRRARMRREARERPG